MNEAGSEQKEQEKIRIQQIAMDPFDRDNIIINAISHLGYPIEYGNHSVDNETGQAYADVYTDTNEHRVDIQNLWYLISISGIGNFLSVIDRGSPHQLAKLIKGDEEGYYDLSPQSSKGMNPDGRYRADDQLLKRFYLTAYERYHQLETEGRMYFKLDPKRGYGSFTATPDESDTALYNDFTKKGVKPISADELIELAKNEGKSIIDQGIETRKSVMELGRQRSSVEEPTQDKPLH